VTLNDLEGSETVRRKYKLLWEAARQVGTTQIRFLGTVGGISVRDPAASILGIPIFSATKRGGSVLCLRRRAPVLPLHCRLWEMRHGAPF